MSWVLVLLLAAALFALLVRAFRLPRMLWTTLLAALAFGLAGYAFQASPDLAAAPRPPSTATRADRWGVVEARKEMMPEQMGSGSAALITADAFARRGRFADAAAILRSAIGDNPRDAEIWLALGNALVEHADGQLTPPAFYAYRRAAEIAPDSPAPGYFLGLAMIRAGRILEARQAWAAALAAAPRDDMPRALLQDRLDHLDSLIAEAQAGNAAQGPPQSGDQAERAAPGDAR